MSRMPATPSGGITTSNVLSEFGRARATACVLTDKGHPKAPPKTAPESLPQRDYQTTFPKAPTHCVVDAPKRICLLYPSGQVATDSSVV